MVSKAEGKALVVEDVKTQYELVCCKAGQPYVTQQREENRKTFRIGSKNFRHKLRRLGLDHDAFFTEDELKSIEKNLAAFAFTSDTTVDVYRRVAPFTKGVEIDLGDNQHTRVQVTPGKVDIITSSSNAYFDRSPSQKPFVMPADEGCIDPLFSYLNLSREDAQLLIAWMTYTLANPKLESTKYVHLVLKGDQGSGKTSMCDTFIRSLVDPSQIGVQIFPSNEKDLAIGSQNAHLLMYDNMRSLSPKMADTLCIAATRGALSARQLYSDADEHIHQLHCAMVLNGIHSFIDQPDLAQRCLGLTLQPIEENKRLSETDIRREFQQDLPGIFRGMLNLIAGIFKHLPDAEVIHPERMIDFVKWLAAMEEAQALPKGSLQSQYSNNLKSTIRDSLLDNALAVAMLRFTEVEKQAPWIGTPTQLLAKLNSLYFDEFGRSKDWPTNAISLSKRLSAMKAGLLSQEVDVQITRGKERNISINSGDLY